MLFTPGADCKFINLSVCIEIDSAYFSCITLPLHIRVWAYLNKLILQTEKPKESERFIDIILTESESQDNDKGSNK